MSCSKIDDLEDLAFDLFEFQEDESRQKAKRDRVVKKHKKVKPISDASTIPPQPQSTQDNQTEQTVEKAPGTHSIFVKTFGCSHNISDSEFMIGQLSQYGYKIVETADQADLVLINSCTVVNPSQDAFINMVCKAKKIKKPIVVAGCVPQGDQNIPELSEVSAIGVTQIDRVVEVVEETLKGHKVQLLTKKELPSLDLPKIRKSKDIQIITINAGCLGACTYCKTVFARGKLLSYDPKAIVSRVNTVAKEGVKEIWLTSQDTGAYGRDIASNISELLISLCEQLKNHDSIMMRIGMTNPPYMLEHLKTIADFLNHPRVFAFIHIPVQAGHNNVLSKMNRQYTVEEFKKVVDYFIENVPNVTIATDIICGFAEQTDEEFEASMQLIQDYKFRVVNINQFYLRPGTPAVNLTQLPSKVVKSRSSKLTQLFKSYDHHSYMIGRQERVWINETENFKGDQFLIGHTKNYTKVILPFDQSLLYKQVIMKITKAFDWHLQGEIIDQNPLPIPVPEGYVEKMKFSLEEEKLKLKIKKEQKINQLKEKKQKLLQKVTTQSKTSEEKPVIEIKKQVKVQRIEIQEKIKELPKSQPKYALLIGCIVCICLAMSTLQKKIKKMQKKMKDFKASTEKVTTEKMNWEQKFGKCILISEQLINRVKRELMGDVVQLAKSCEFKLNKLKQESQKLTSRDKSLILRKTNEKSKSKNNFIEQWFPNTNLKLKNSNNKSQNEEENKILSETTRTNRLNNGQNLQFMPTKLNFGNKFENSLTHEYENIELKVRKEREQMEKKFREKIMIRKVDISSSPNKHSLRSQYMQYLFQK